jgi:hypothetical protein
MPDPDALMDVTSNWRKESVDGIKTQNTKGSIKIKQFAPPSL